MNSLGQTPEAAETVAVRLNAATVAHRDAQEVSHRCAATFRKACVEALDAGMTQKDVAEIAGVTRARLHAIIATEYARR